MTESIQIPEKVYIAGVALKVEFSNNHCFGEQIIKKSHGRHDDLKAIVKHLFIRGAYHLTITDGFWSDEEKFFTRKETMDLFKEGKLGNHLIAHGAELQNMKNNQEMQSIYLW